MNRNVESHFSQLPNVDISRSRFDRSSSVKTSFNVGELIPFYVDEVLPGDTFKVKTSKVIRMQPMVAPIMDNVYLDTYYFFVPNRLVWTHWRELMGENTQSAWIPTTEYSVPQVESPSGGWNIGTIADYMGVPTGVEGLSINALPFRAYSLICNEWFRDENLTDPLVFPTGDVKTTGSNGNNYLVDVAAGGKPFLAAKYHDYFTSCLPSPQKGPDVTIPIAQLADMPVYTSAETHSLSQYALSFNNIGGDTLATHPLYARRNGSKTTAAIDASTVSGKTVEDAIPNNLFAAGSNALTATSINELRRAFQIQKLYERDARGGTRYVELLKSHFGVTSPDARLQRPEYLGGNRVPITINQVLQQSATVEGSTPQGTPTGLSLTSDTNSDFTKSFVEHGFVIGVMVARYDHTYQQGLNRMWSRKSRFDYYWPVFANIGEQAVLNKEIYAQGLAKDNEVFGYQEAWADYRYRPNICTGEMRSQAVKSLDVWHLGDDYSSLPSLSDAWIREDKSNLDRSLAVNSSVSNQLWADIYVQNICTRPMPMYSIPGLIDHH
nr:MAG: major capsid protein [Microviridae sp.]